MAEREQNETESPVVLLVYRRPVSPARLSVGEGKGQVSVHCTLTERPPGTCGQLYCRNTPPVS